MNRKQFKPFRKENSKLQYININSNHPPAIKKQLPITVSRRLSTLSSNKEIFKNEMPMYNEALVQAGYPDNSIQYYEAKNVSNLKKKTRSRKIIWFNPPFNSTVSTNIAKRFLMLIDKHFPKGSAFHKFFNRNTVKVSYSCMPNIRSIIAAKNKKLLKSADVSENNRGCNCNTGTDNCPLKGNCLTKSLIYRAIVKPKNEPNAKNYYGLTSSTFKTRFAQHTSSFRNQNQSRITSLSKYIWKLKEESKEYDVSWEITALAPPYSKEALPALPYRENLNIILEQS